MFLVSKHGETFIPGESTPDRFTVFEDEPMSLERILSQIENDSWETSSWPSINEDTWLRTTDPDRDYETGEETYYSLHIRPMIRPGLTSDLFPHLKSGQIRPYRLFAKHLRKIYLLAGVIKPDQLPWPEKTSYLERLLTIS